MTESNGRRLGVYDVLYKKRSCSKTATEKIAIAVLLFLIISAGIVVYPRVAAAIGTGAGTTIVNTATVSYSVHAVPQLGRSATTSFKVDDKVSFTLTANDSTNVILVPGGRASLSYLLANVGNGPHDFTLNPTLLAGNGFTPTTGAFYADQAGTSPLAVDGSTGLAYLSQVQPDETRTVYWFITAPSQVADAAATYSVTAEAYLSGNLGNANPVKSSTQAAADASVNKNASAGNVLVILADGHGNGGDADRDGKYSVVSKDGSGNTVGFLVQTPVVTVVKTSSLYKDPLNGIYNAITNKLPRAIPGATVTYQVTVRNAGPALASSLSISDTLPSTVTFVQQYDDGVMHCSSGQGIVVNNICATNSGTWNGTNGITVSGLSAAANGGQAIIKYQVTIN
jgi:uncharacterized repeat protein (TIGR01451 family)